MLELHSLLILSLLSSGEYLSFFYANFHIYCLFFSASLIDPLYSSLCVFPSMARGHQKIQSQQKNAKKQAEMKKSKGHDQKTAAKAALVFTCSVCKSQMPDPKTFKQHFESKHPKSPLPPELEGVEA
ncbi:hypothetical protein CHARACLAT_016679 [Characodon lateralis]|uniref:Zinc finger protein 706 n=1 Tax=Characodon lateralis TaxID=208331 RepID=A0ABU7F4X3_9TELE|nr:hypothetical protein [Characodon lateralis]